MQDLILQITGNQLFGVGSVIGIGLFIFLIRKYFSNVEKTSNQFYKKLEETMPHYNANLNSAGSSNDKIIVLWNGDLASTYLLVDALIQDKIIQPIYFEKYSIAKHIHKKKLNEYSAGINNTIYSEKDKILFKQLAKLKTQEKIEKGRIEMLRETIKRKYPEFANNLLPTLYVTNIAKDLDFTTDFFVKLRDIVNTTKHIDYDGIEFIEQIMRFFKHYEGFDKTKIRILAGYGKDTRIIENINSMLNKYTINAKFSIIIELPLKNMIMDDLKFQAGNVLDASIMNYWY